MPQRNSNQYGRTIDRQIRRMFSGFMREAKAGDRVFLRDVLNDWNSIVGPLDKDSDLSLAEAFDSQICNRFRIFVDEEEWSALQEELKELRDFKRKVVPIRQETAA